MGPFKNKVKKTKSFKTTFLRNNNRCLELYASSKFLFHVLMMMMTNNKQTNNKQTNDQSSQSIIYSINQSIIIIYTTYHFLVRYIQQVKRFTELEKGIVINQSNILQLFKQSFKQPFINNHSNSFKQPHPNNQLPNDLSKRLLSFINHSSNNSSNVKQHSVF